MSIELDPRWQEEAYKQIDDDFREKNRSCVVAPTGCGKTALGLRLIEENPNKNYTWITSSSIAIQQIKALMLEVYGGEKPFPNLKFMTYNALSRMKQTEFDKLKPETIILDELHRAGANIWNLRVKELIENNTNANILGLTATPIRTDGRNMAEEICGGVSYKLDLAEAMARGILPIPIYVVAKYIFKEDTEELLNRADLIEDEKKKTEVKKLIAEASRKLENSHGLQDVFEKYMKDSTGKYIIFCKHIDHIHELEELFNGENGWFKKVNPELKIVKIFSENEKKENEIGIQFLRSKAGKNLFIALSRDMLNESFHDENLSGIIMTRPTRSEVLFRQQLGRALMRDSKERPIVFDLVNNIMYFEQLRIEIKTIVERGRAKGNKKLYDEKILDEFQIFAEQIEAIEEFNKIERYLNNLLKGETSIQRLIRVAKDIQEAGYDFTEFKTVNRNREFITINDLGLAPEIVKQIIEKYKIPEGFKIGQHVYYARRVYRDKMYGAMTEEDKKNLESIPRNYR